MQVRRLRPGDEEVVLRAAHLFDDASDPRAVRTYLRDERNVLFLAFEANAPVGFLRGTELGQLKNERKQMFLYEVAVDPKFHRHGVGRALVQTLLSYCREREVEEVFVFTDPSNESAVGLYRSTGAVTETAADRMFVYSLRAANDPRR